MDSEKHLEFILTRIAQWCFVIPVSISAVSLLGWAFGLLIVASIYPDYIPMAPSTAVCFSLVSIPLCFYVLYPEKPSIRIVTTAAALLTSLICLLLLAGFFLGKQFEVEYREIRPHVYYAQVPVGHMSPITATTFLVTAMGVLFLVFSDKGRQRFKHIAAFMAMAVVITGFVIILGYLDGTPLLYGGTIIPVALTTAIAFVLTGLGLITASGPNVLPVRVFAGPTVSSRLMRTFLPAITTFVLIDGLAYKATFSSAANPALIAALIAFLSMIVVAIIVSKIAASIGGEIDRAHSEQDRLNLELKEALDKVKTLSGLLPICASCKKIRDDQGYWNQIETYISEHSKAEFTHAICPDCGKKLYPQYYEKVWGNKQKKDNE